MEIPNDDSWDFELHTPGCGNCKHWSKGNNKYRGVQVGSCALGFYDLLMPMDRSEPYYLEVPVALDNGIVACGAYEYVRFAAGEKELEFTPGAPGLTNDY